MVGVVDVGVHVRLTWPCRREVVALPAKDTYTTVCSRERVPELSSIHVTREGGLCRFRCVRCRLLSLSEIIDGGLWGRGKTSGIMSEDERARI